MRALTIWQPWASAIAYGPKRVENRSWFAPRGRYRMAIHAAAKRRSAYDEEEDLLDCLQWWPSAREAQYPRGAVIAVATLVACHRNEATSPRTPWAVPGEVGWWFEGVVPLAEPVRCRGQQGLWTLPPEVEQKVLAMEGRG